MGTQAAGLQRPWIKNIGGLGTFVPQGPIVYSSNEFLCLLFDFKLQRSVWLIAVRKSGLPPFLVRRGQAPLPNCTLVM